MASITFLNPHALWALFLIPVIVTLHFYLLKFTRRKSLTFSNFETMRRVTGEMVMTKNIMLLVMRISIILFLILSASGMTIWYSGRSNEFNYVLTIDASSSMLADDFTPTRLEAAKETAGEFIDHLSARTKIGLVTFSGTSFVMQRLTDSLDDVAEKVSNIKISEVGGTDLGEALITATNVLLADEKPGAIILLTDGQSTVGTPIEEGVFFARDNHMTVYTVGIATEKGGQFANIPLVSKIDEESLQYIADNTGGKFFLAQSKDALRDAFKSINTSQKSTVPVRLAAPFLIIGLILLFVEWALINTKYRTMP